MPARAKAKTPGRPARKSTRQGNDSVLGTPGWQKATSDMFASPSFTPPQSPPRSRQVKGGRVTKAKAGAKPRRQTIMAAAKVTSPRLTRGRRATMLPSELVTIKSPPGTRRRASIYQKPAAAKKGTAADDFKMPDPVAIMRGAARKKSSPAKRVSPKKTQAKPVKKAPSPKRPAKVSPQKEKFTEVKKSTSPKQATKKRSPAKTNTQEKKTVSSKAAPKSPPKKTVSPKASPKPKSPPKKLAASKEKTPKKVIRTRTPKVESPKNTSIDAKNILVTPSNTSLGSTKRGASTGRATRSAKQVKVTPKVAKTPSSTPKVAKTPSATPKVAKTPSVTPKVAKTPSTTPKVAKTRTTTPKVMTAQSAKKPSPIAPKGKTTLTQTRKNLRNITDGSLSSVSFYSSPKAGTPAAKIAKARTTETTLLTPVNKPLERLRTLGTESSKKVRIQSEKNDSLTKVYRKTPSRGPGTPKVTRKTDTENTTPVKAAKVLGKTPKSTGKKFQVKPKILVESLVSPKTSTPAELRKRRADFPEPLSEIRLAKVKRTALELTNEESDVADMTADLSVARPQDVRPSSWWGWCNIL